MKCFDFLLLLGVTATGIAMADNDRWDLGKYGLSKLPPTASKTGVTCTKDI